MTEHNPGATPENPGVTEEEFDRIAALVQATNFGSEDVEKRKAGMAALKQLHEEARESAQLRNINYVIESMMRTEVAAGEAMRIKHLHTARLLEGVRLIVNSPLEDPDAPVGRET